MSAPSEPLQGRFEHALALPASERKRYLAELARTDPAAAERVKQLLAASESGASPLDADPWRALDDEEDDSLPERIGPYRVVSEIGRGGMGRVYLALQEGDGFTRRLAVKMVAPDGARPDIERRFRDERRILAALEHPGIARFHDAARDAEGRWYLALEYVDGANLIEHARARALSAVERLRLFRAVLEAVAYAHERSIVHRDLKPANILVGDDGRPRLLDFGIAKLLEPGDAPGSAALTEATRTRTSLRAMTPAYASPEQFRGDPVTPASDVFSLGVVLYELLSGVRPFRGRGDSHAALEREILEADPEPPSTASRRAGATGEPSTASGERLPRDLDAICLKALRKEPAERYATAAELGADLDRHLAGLPVAARGEDRRYRLRRFLGRNRAALAASAALAVAVAAVVFALAAWRGSDRAEPAAEPPPRPFPFSGLSARDAGELEAEFVASPASVETGARLALALERSGRHDEAALIVARLRQIPGHAEDPLVDYVEATGAASGGQPQRALVLFGTALDRAIAGGRGELVAQIRASRGRLLSTLGRPIEARADMEAARRDFEASGDRASLSRVLNDLAIEPLEQGRLAEGEALLEQALAEARASGGGGPGLITLNLATVALQRGFPDRAEARSREVVAIFRDSKSRRLGFALISLADALLDLGRPREASAALDEAIRFLSGATSERDLAYALRLRGICELQEGETELAAATASRLESLAKSSGDRIPLAFANRLRGELAGARGDREAARELLGEARRQFLDGGDHDWAAEAALVEARIEVGFGEPVAARQLATAVLTTAGASLESPGSFLAEALLAELDASQGARDDAARRLAALETASAGTTSTRRRIALMRARAALAQAEGRPDAARDELAAAAAIARGAGRLVETQGIERDLARIAATAPPGG